MENNIVLKATNLVKRYPFSQGGAFFAVNNISLTLKKGEFLAVIGTSGSGKSTLMHALSGMDKPTNGKVEILGTDIYSLSDDELTAFRAKNIGVIFQFFNLIPILNVEENVAFPQITLGKKPDFEKISELLKRLDIEKLASRLPNSLSGGQQQRAAIARAIINKPSLVIADEPTGNLDQKTGSAVIDELETLCRENGTALIIVTHDPNIAARADKIIKIEDGKIV